MSTYTTRRHINVRALPFPCVMRADTEVGTYEVEADVTSAVLTSAVDAAPLDTSEQDASVTRANMGAIAEKARQALDVNATFLALASPTNAQNAAQVKAVTRECNALIRIVLGLLDDTAGT